MYGITDALSKSGGLMTGGLILHADPLSNDNLVTKQYVDTTITELGSSSSLVTGEIIRKLTSTTLFGFLRSNGVLVSKTTYADLYVVIGNNYSVFTMPGSGKPWKQQYYIVHGTARRYNWLYYKYFFTRAIRLVISYSY